MRVRDKQKKKETDKRWYLKNRERLLIQGREYARIHRSERQQNYKEWLKQHPEKSSYYTLKCRWKKLGIDIDKLPPKPLTCDVCNKKCRVTMDHCHTKNVFRGWLCIQCNTALGDTYDNVEILEKLISYLKEHHADSRD